VSIPPAELARLSAVRTANWDQRQSIRAGACLEQPVFWCVNQDPDTVTVLIGPDDEMWEIAVVIPIAAVETVARGQG